VIVTHVLIPAGNLRQVQFLYAAITHNDRAIAGSEHDLSCGVLTPVAATLRMPGRAVKNRQA
jgi:hypothetical protein